MSFLIGGIIGFVAGLLVGAKHKAKVDEAKEKF